MRPGSLLALMAALAIPHAALSQQQARAATHQVAFEVTGVSSDAGTVRVSLCGDTKAPFPGGCVTHAGVQPAKRGSAVVVTIPGVAPGRYAVQAFHDANGNGRAEIPPEGYAFGNGAPFPPTFDAASIVVGDSDAHATLAMQYVGSAPPRLTQGSHGAEPPIGIERIDLREQGLYGELYRPASVGTRKRLPAVMLIGGSEGGLDTMSQMAVSFARAGYAALTLAYWAETGLPQQLESIPLEYFDRGLEWLAGQPDIDAKSMALLGWSRGGEAALLVGTRNSRLRAVVAVAPSSIVWQGMSNGGSRAQSAWTVKGQPLPHVVPDATRYRPNASLAPLFEARFAEADARPDTAIPVERLHAPLLLITGGDDGVWPARRFADRIVARLQGAGFRHAVQHLDYEGAGHFIFVGEPDGMLSRAASTASGGVMGGTAAANAAAWKDNWPRTLAFLDDAMKEKSR